MGELLHLLYNGPLLRDFNVAIKSIKNFAVFSTKLHTVVT